jgi:hypothetical protein
MFQFSKNGFQNVTSHGEECQQGIHINTVMLYTRYKIYNSANAKVLNNPVNVDFRKTSRCDHKVTNKDS